MKVFSFKKQERLSHLNEINSLFRDGNAFNVNPLRFVYRLIPSNPEIKILTSVPRRKFKKAVTRNRIKRLMRESYRHNKPEISSIPSGLHIGFVFIGDNEFITQSEIDKAMSYGLKRLVSEINR